MRNKERDKFFIQSIREEIKRIEGFVRGVSHENFLEDLKSQFAIYKSFENIGEAVKSISNNSTPIRYY